jgi:predicted SAM-dependent methyltransferase
LELAERFDEIYGLDIHENADAVAATFAREQIEVSLKQGSILEPPYPDGYFDAVLAISILEHLQPEEQPAVMQQVHRMLRPGGVFVVGVPELNRRMSLAFRMFGYDISQHHFSDPKTVLDAAMQVFSIDQKVNLPAFAPDIARLYVWFVARKV